MSSPAKIVAETLLSMTPREEVRLEIPALPEFFNIVRLTASGLGSRLGFTIDQVDDLKLAIDELCFGVTGPHARNGTITIRFWPGTDSIEVAGATEFHDAETASGRHEQSELSKLILNALVDEHELHLEPTSPTFRILKRRAAEP